MEKVILTEWTKQSRNQIEGKKGVYSIIVNDKRVYIGSTWNLIQRLRRFFGCGSQSLVRQGIKFSIEILIFNDINEMVYTESEMIKQYKPSNNYCFLANPNKSDKYF